MTLDREAIRRACEEATPGPWTWHPHTGPAKSILVGGAEPRWLGSPWNAWEGTRILNEASDGPMVADAMFIAGARTWVPELLADNDRLREALRNARESLRNDLPAEALHHIATALLDKEQPVVLRWEWPR